MGFVANYIRNLPAVALGRQPTRPLMFSYYITHRCELNCRYCCDGDGRRFKEDPHPELTTDEAKRLLTILRAAADTLDVTGGEPLLRPDLEPILAHAKEMGFRTVLNTKGVGLEDRPNLMEHADVLVLSLDTLDPEALAALLGRPVQIAKRVMRGLQFALSMRERTKTKVVLSAVTTPENIDGVADVLRFARENNLGFHLSPEIEGTRANPLLRGHAGYRALLDEVIKRKRERAGVLGVTEYLRGIRDFSSFRCRPLLMPVIRPDGRMYYPCLESKQAEVSLLEAADYREALREARERCGDIPECQDCCHIFCHMALSLLQGHPLSALGELHAWSA